MQRVVSAVAALVLIAAIIAMTLYLVYSAVTYRRPSQRCDPFIPGSDFTCAEYDGECCEVLQYHAPDPDILMRGEVVCPPCPPCPTKEAR